MPCEVGDWQYQVSWHREKLTIMSTTEHPFGSDESASGIRSKTNLLQVYKVMLKCFFNLGGYKRAFITG